MPATLRHFGAVKHLNAIFEIVKNERMPVPKGTRDAVLHEYNHRCAVCATDRPQLHHIDEDPANNAPENLLPLCPNCHLTDQHDPTRRMGVEKLALFRRYKDPAILSPEFQPLFARFQFLLSVDPTDTSETERIEARVAELVGFVRALEMGSFYAGQIEQLTATPFRGFITFLGEALDPERQRQYDESCCEYRRHLIEVRDEIAHLVVELLRYQSWSRNSA